MTANDDIYIVGVGLHPFGRHEGLSGLDMGVYAVNAALGDAGLGWASIDVAVGGSNTAKPDSLVGRLGLTGLAFYSVRNGCATGAVALAMAANALRVGEGKLALAVGFDKHERGAFNSDAAAYGLSPWYPRSGLMVTTQYFAMRTRRYLHDHSLGEHNLAQISALMSRAGAANPFAWRRKELSEDEVLSAAMICNPLTKLMFCQPGEGGAAVVLARGSRAFDICEAPVRLASVAVRTRGAGSFEVYSPSLTAERGNSPTVPAAAAALTSAGVGAGDIDIAQIQDTDSGSALIALAETGLCQHGEQAELLEDQSLELNGWLPVNTDGGCLANGEPIGASGLRQIHEVTRQLQRKPLGAAVTTPPRVGFTHVYGAPGIAACTVLAAPEM
jgi:acetyl-CoA acetyltransferase